MIETIVIVILVLGGGGWACAQIYHDFHQSTDIASRIEKMSEAEREYARGELNGAFKEIARRHGR